MLSDMSDKKPRPKDLLELGERVRSARQEAKLTQADLSKRAGIARDTLSRLERGEPVDTPTLTRVLSALGYRMELQRMRLRAADMRRKYAHLHEDAQ
jgi:transcriptional regulator with XRE-family HTH domain